MRSCLMPKLLPVQPNYGRESDRQIASRRAHFDGPQKSRLALGVRSERSARTAHARQTSPRSDRQGSARLRLQRSQDERLTTSWRRGRAGTRVSLEVGRGMRFRPSPGEPYQPMPPRASHEPSSAPRARQTFILGPLRSQSVRAGSPYPWRGLASARSARAALRPHARREPQSRAVEVRHTTPSVPRAVLSSTSSPHAHFGIAQLRIEPNRVAVATARSVELVKCTNFVSPIPRPTSSDTPFCSISCDLSV